MNKSDFFYHLPEELIAQTPLEPRDSSRLMVVDKQTGEIGHKVFTDIVSYFNKGDVLVLNNSKVLPARIYGKKESGASVEFLLLKQVEKDIWEVLTKPGKKAKPGVKFNFGEGLLQGEVLQIIEDGKRLVKFSYNGNFYETLEKIGQMPLPPYIKKTLKDQNRYQTVYAKEQGSAAAPTAGLHFTQRVFDSLKEKGVEICFVTLHVGLGTFRPVKEENILDHQMHSEHFHIEQETVDTINAAKAGGNKVFAAGTTTVRTLEAVHQKHGKLIPCEEDTDIFIYPGYEFQVVDNIITNFHLPESTLLMLVSAYSGKELILKAYETAVKEKYRFFSFGDCMLLH